MYTDDDDSPRVTEEQLMADLDAARQEFLESIAALDEIVCDIPSHLPAPDGAYRIRNIAKSRDVAYAKYKAAVKRLKDHTGDTNS
jgi:hypothetical protein